MFVRCSHSLLFCFVVLVIIYRRSDASYWIVLLLSWLLLPPPLLEGWWPDHLIESLSMTIWKLLSSIAVLIVSSTLMIIKVSDFYSKHFRLYTRMSMCRDASLLLDKPNVWFCFLYSFFNLPSVIVFTPQYHLYIDELKFCNRLACILTKERDLPKLCQGFPTVVQTVNQHDVELQQHEPMMTFHHEQYQQFPPARINYDSFSVPPPSDR